MTDREKLIELIVTTPVPCMVVAGVRGGRSLISASVIADHLLANGVTVQTNTEKPPTDLTGKCGSCAFSEPTVAFGGSKCHVLCVNKDIRGRGSKSKLSAVKQRTARACKRYVPKEGR